jgi:hypothetical protein
MECSITANGMVDATVKSSVSEDNLTKVRDIRVRILS